MPSGDRRADDPRWDDFVAASIGGRVEGAFRAGLYREVAHVDCDELGRVFPLTNHIEHDWTTNDAVILHADRCRPTSVGDVVLDEAGELHACATMGWRQVDATHRDAFLRNWRAKFQFWRMAAVRSYRCRGGGRCGEGGLGPPFVFIGGDLQRLVNQRKVPPIILCPAPVSISPPELWIIVSTFDVASARTSVAASEIVAFWAEGRSVPLLR